MDTALIEGANIAGFMYKDKKMQSQDMAEDGTPNLLLNGKTGELNVSNKFVAKIVDGQMLVEIDGSVIADSIMASGLNIQDKFVVSIDENGNANIKAVGDITARKLETADSGKRFIIDPSDSSMVMYDSTGKKVIEFSFMGDDGLAKTFPRIRLYNYRDEDQIASATDLTYASVAIQKFDSSGVVTERAGMTLNSIAVMSDAGNIMSSLTSSGLRLFRDGVLYKAFE